MRFIVSSFRATRRGFTLLEMLTASAVLILMVALLVPMFSSLTSTTANSREKLETDVIARQALDRIGRDLSLMPLREDLDYFLRKESGNDEFDFFTRVPGVLGAGTSDPESGLTLVGYRVIDGNLERIAVAQSFDDLTFLTFDEAGALVAGTGITEAIAATSAADYHVIGPGVFRFELGFLLRDGSFATLPMDTRNNPGGVADPGFREWSPPPHGFARVRVPDGPSNTVFRSLGWEDVAAVVVTIAIVEPGRQGQTTPAELAAAADRLSDAVASTDATDPDLPVKVWRTTLGTPGSLSLPDAVQNGVRIYQRTFYLDSPSA